jgi:hypothetical protein
MRIRTGRMARISIRRWCMRTFSLSQAVMGVSASTINVYPQTTRPRLRLR